MLLCLEMTTTRPTALCWACPLTRSMISEGTGLSRPPTEGHGLEEESGMMGIDTKLTGSQILARSLRSQQLSVLFYIMGGPMLEAERRASRRVSALLMFDTRRLPL